MEVVKLTKSQLILVLAQLRLSVSGEFVLAGIMGTGEYLLASEDQEHRIKSEDLHGTLETLSLIPDAERVLSIGVCPDHFTLNVVLSHE